MTTIDELAAALPDSTADGPGEVFRRCEAADALGVLGPSAAPAVPALIRTLTVRVTVDCVDVLRVAAARALWRIDGRADLALPHLTRALQDDNWGVVRTAVETLAEMGTAAQPAAPDLIALARKRLVSGPFHFEQWVEAPGREPLPPLLADLATAIGRCAAAHAEGQAVLSEMVRDPDERVRAAAAAGLASG